MLTNKRPPSVRAPSPRTGFSLVELMVVIVIITIAFGMITMLPRGNKRDADVSAAAEELAGTLRQARTLAMDRRCIAGVSFNIQNAPGTSGKILNNNSGGHWYRIIGPIDAIYSIEQNGSPVYPFMSLAPTDCPFVFLNNVKNSWIGDRHQLAQRRVRFLALSDQDNGSAVDTANGDAFPATYPRPWCGYWDPATRQLRPWGGYDPALLDANSRQCSGFYYAGKDGTILNSVNHADRFTSGWYYENGKGTIIPPALKIFGNGEGRPLINGNWLDYVIRFLPDGTANEGDVFRTRTMSLEACHDAANINGAGGANFPGDFGDMFPSYPLKSMSRLFQQNGSRTPMTSYVGFTGFWSITLAPDVMNDSDLYPSAGAAFDSLMPAYRVMVNHLGLVKVVKIMSFRHGGANFDTTITNWQNISDTQNYYKNDVATDINGNNRGQPVSDFLMPEVLGNRTWWLQ